MSIPRYIALVLIGCSSFAFGGTGCTESTIIEEVPTVQYTIAPNNNVEISSTNILLADNGSGSFNLTNISGNDPDGTCVTISSAKGALILQEFGADVPDALNNANEHIKVDYTCPAINAENTADSLSSPATVFQPVRAGDELNLYEAPAGRVFDNQTAACVITLHVGENLSTKQVGTYQDTITVALESGECGTVLS